MQKTINKAIPLIETDIWVPNPEKPGYLMFDRMKTNEEVYEELVQILKAENVYDELDYFSNRHWPRIEKEPFPEYKWIACFAVQGGSEGHYIHIETINNNQRELVFLGKTFLGLEHAMKVANICTQAFHG